MSRTSLVSAIFSWMWIFFCTKGSVDPISFSFSFPFWRFSLSDSSEHWSSIVSIFSINCLKPTGGGILARARCALCGLSCLAPAPMSATEQAVAPAGNAAGARLRERRAGLVAPQPHPERSNHAFARQYPKRRPFRV